MENKTLYRVPQEGVISGVCAGIAEYLNMDLSLVRVLFVIISLFTGFPLILYIVFALVLPNKESVMNRYQQEEEVYDKDDYTL